MTRLVQIRESITVINEEVKKLPPSSINQILQEGVTRLDAQMSATEVFDKNITSTINEVIQDVIKQIFKLFDKVVDKKMAKKLEEQDIAMEQMKLTIASLNDRLQQKEQETIQTKQQLAQIFSAKNTDINTQAYYEKTIADLKDANLVLKHKGDLDSLYKIRKDVIEGYNNVLFLAKKLEDAPKKQQEIIFPKLIKTISSNVADFDNNVRQVLYKASEESKIDVLTGLKNRDSFYTDLAEACLFSQEKQMDLPSILLIAIDQVVDGENNVITSSKERIKELAKRINELVESPKANRSSKYYGFKQRFFSILAYNSINCYRFESENDNDSEDNIYTNKLDLEKFVILINGFKRDNVIEIAKYFKQLSKKNGDDYTISVVGSSYQENVLDFLNNKMDDVLESGVCRVAEIDNFEDLRKRQKIEFYSSDGILVE